MEDNDKLTSILGFIMFQYFIIILLSLNLSWVSPSHWDWGQDNLPGCSFSFGRKGASKNPYHLAGPIGGLPTLFSIPGANDQSWSDLDDSELIKA